MFWTGSDDTAPSTTLTGSRCSFPDGGSHCPLPSNTVSPAGKRGVMVSARNCCHSSSVTIFPSLSVNPKNSRYSVTGSRPLGHCWPAAPDPAVVNNEKMRTKLNQETRFNPHGKPSLVIVQDPTRSCLHPKNIRSILPRRTLPPVRPPAGKNPRLGKLGPERVWRGPRMGYRCPTSMRRGGTIHEKTQGHGRDPGGGNVDGSRQSGGSSRLHPRHRVGRGRQAGQVLQRGRLPRRGAVQGGERHRVPRIRGRRSGRA